MLFGSLDFIYIPSHAFETELAYYTNVLGGELIFRVHAMDAKVAQIRLGEGPALLLADHLEGQTPILIYRVDHFEEALKALETRGWQRETVFEIPHGPCCSFVAEGGQRFAVYELLRPEANTHFAGRMDD